MRGKGHHSWLTSHMTAELILHMPVLLPFETGENRLMQGYQTGYHKMQVGTDIYSTKYGYKYGFWDNAYMMHGVHVDTKLMIP